jgi:hypothetical protein
MNSSLADGLVVVVATIITGSHSPRLSWEGLNEAHAVWAQINVKRGITSSNFRRCNAHEWRW